MLDIGLNDKILLNDPLDLAIQELDILFNTTPTEMIGNSTYGMNFLQFLWQLTPSTKLLKKYIREKVIASTIYLKRLKYDIDVDYYIDNGSTVYVVKIVIYTDSKNIEKSYIVR